MTTSRSDRQQWMRFFERAIQGASSSDLMSPADAVEYSANLADAAMVTLESRFPPEPAPPLFEPLLKQYFENQAKDDTDSSFKIGR